MGPFVLPITEQIYCAISILLNYLLNKKKLKNIVIPGIGRLFPKSFTYKAYIPDFKRCIDHFCIHAGGRAVIEGVQKNLKLSNIDVEPSFQTLRNYGNTSSSSIWYEMKYIEENAKRMNFKRGNRILQIAFGSGFKCNGAVWLRLTHVD